MLINRIKLAKALLQLAEAATDKGNLIYEGELTEGTEVFIEKEGEIVPAEDGEYISGEKKIIVKEGKVEAIEEIKEEPIEEPAVEEPVMEEPAPVAEEEVAEEAPVEDSKDALIAELILKLDEREAQIASLEAIVKDLEAQLASKEEALKMSADIPAKEKVKKLHKNETGLKFNVFKN